MINSTMDPWAYQNGGFMMPRMTRAVKILLISTFVAFIVQQLSRHIFGTCVIAHDVFGRELVAWSVDRLFGLSSDFILRGRIWQIVTYMFLHAGVWHVIMNMLLLYFLGPETERGLGTRRFFILYFVCGILGGLGWFLVGSWNGSHCIGASGAVFGVAGAFAGLYPKLRIGIIFTPITVTARTLAICMGLFVLLSVTVPETGGIAHAAHLVGGIAGYLYGLRVARESFYGGDLYAPGSVRDWFADIMARFRRSKFKTVLGDSDSPPSQAEVDAVLDKLAGGGWSALTRKDRDLLDRASRSEVRDQRSDDR